MNDQNRKTLKEKGGFFLTEGLLIISERVSQKALIKIEFFLQKQPPICEAEFGPNVFIELFDR